MDGIITIKKNVSSYFRSVIFLFGGFTIGLITGTLTVAATPGTTTIKSLLELKITNKRLSRIILKNFWSEPRNSPSVFDLKKITH